MEHCVLLLKTDGTIQEIVLNYEELKTYLPYDRIGSAPLFGTSPYTLGYLFGSPEETVYEPINPWMTRIVHAMRIPSALWIITPARIKGDCILFSYIGNLTKKDWIGVLGRLEYLESCGPPQTALLKEITPYEKN